MGKGGGGARTEGHAAQIHAQPSDAERAQAIAWVRAELSAYAEKRDGDPGKRRSDG